MVSALRHRGPDGHAVRGFPVENSLVDAALGHARLSIIDLSDDGAEPMANEDGSLWLTFNGEIYNHADLRHELQQHGHVFRSRCDAEVLLHGFEQWGPGLVHRLVGMWAFALWDVATRVLWLSRDPFGIKPLLWTTAIGETFFASELGALEAVGQGGPVDAHAVSLFLGLGFVPSPYALRRDVRQLEPGTVLRVDASGARIVDRVTVPHARGPRSHGSAEQAAGELRPVIRRAVQQHMVSDVEVGLFLSGGVDSALVAMAAREVHGGELRAFTLAVDDPALDESVPAAHVAEQLGIRHHVHRLSSEHALQRLPGILEAMDEPLADASVLPTRLVAEAAREHVKVVLSGDGGDELFGGYTRHQLALAAARARPVVDMAGSVADVVSPQRVDAWYARARLLVPRLPPLHSPSTKLRLLTQSVTDGPAAFYGRMFRATQPDDLATLHVDDNATAFLRMLDVPADALAMAQAVDLQTWLPGDILRKVDRATMAVGLEARVPLLSIPVARAAAGLPREALVSGGVGKRVLRVLVAQRLGDAYAGAPKRGFGLPMRDWLRGPLKSWRTDMLASLATRGVVDGGGLQRLQDEHDSGTDHASALFALVALEAWWRPRASSTGW